MDDPRDVVSAPPAVWGLPRVFSLGLSAAVRTTGLEWVIAPDQAVSMTEGRTRAQTTQVALASHVRPGDHVACDGRYVEVLRVRRAQGRKPPDGENLHLVGTDEVIKVDSLDGIRILARNMNA